MPSYGETITMIETIGSYYIRSNGQERIEVIWDEEQQEGFCWNVHQQQRWPNYWSTILIFEDDDTVRTASSRQEVVEEWKRIQRAIDDEERERREFLRAQDFEDEGYDTVTAIRMARET